MFRIDELLVRIVELRGSYYQFGVEQGKEIRALPIFHQLDQLRALTDNANSQNAKKILQNISPKLFQELEGLAEGLNMQLDAVTKLFSGYDVIFPQMGCTTLAKDNFYVRNYDFSPEMYDARLVFTNPTDGYISVGFSQQIVGRLDGMNEKGLVVGLHFVNNEHREEGFIATTIVRMLLEQCANIEEAVKYITAVPHGYCYNFSLTDPSGNSVTVEASPKQQVIVNNNQLICTNHFESDTLREKNRSEVQSSIKRKESVSLLLNQPLSPLAAYHHFNNGNSPLFFKYYKEYFGTLHTVVYSPKDLSMIVGVGEDCAPFTFSLKEYIEGTLVLPETIQGKIQLS